ncbi:hypothetical protein QTP88_006202 [Uroleucon formosanum]
MSLMYRLYRDEYCKNNNIIPVSDFAYRSVFHDYDPSLSFFIPKKDQCTKCNSYQMAPNKSTLQEEWEMHKLRENQAMNMKAEDKKKAIENKGLHFRSVTFDLQAILSIPFASDSQIYYKRKLNVYNFTIMDASKNDGYCFVWDENNGKRGSNEIGSLLKYIFDLPDSVTHLTAFSDTCGGQNRNQFVCTALLYAVNKKTNLDLIDLKFMESGHLYLECYSMHATIERKNLVGRSVKNVSTTITNQKVNWIKIKWIRVEKSKPQTIQFKYNLYDSQILEIDIALDKKTRLQHKDPFDWLTIVPKQLYEKKLSISAEEKKDLMSLLNKKVIPEEYAHFEEIPTTKKNISNRDSDGDYDKYLASGDTISSIMYAFRIGESTVSSYRGADIDTDHFLLILNFTLKLQDMKRLKEKKSVKFNVDLLKNENVRKKYTDSIDVKLNGKRVGNIETDWSKISQVIKETVEQSIGGMQNGNKSKEKKWYNEICREAIKKRRIARSDFIRTGSQIEKNIFLNERKNCKRIIQREKRNFINGILEETEKDRSQGKIRNFFKTIGWYKDFNPTLEAIKNKNGNTIMEPSDEAKIWREYFIDLLNAEIPVNPIGKAHYQTAEPMISDITLDEVKVAINSLKNWKAPGSDDIPAELIKYGGEEMHKVIFKICQKTWEEEQMPEEWKKAVINNFYY